MQAYEFIKMHGAGNDFVIIDLRQVPGRPSAEEAAAIADRRRGVGCDQLILIEPSDSGLADAQITFLNSDGTESAACGNGTRCVAELLMAQIGVDHLTLETGFGLLDCDRDRHGRITVDMGPARTGASEIPIADDRDTLHLGLEAGTLKDPVGVSMGNPHAVFFVDDAEAVPLASLGPKLEHDRLFPERANIGVAEIRSRNAMRLRVWERGAGLTLACGSGACAAVVAAVRRGLTDRRVDIEMDGGTLTVEWLENGHVLLSGPVAYVFEGRLTVAQDRAEAAAHG